jgi:hypothetical protein
MLISGKELPKLKLLSGFRKKTVAQATITKGIATAVIKIITSRTGFLDFNTNKRLTKIMDGLKAMNKPRKVISMKFKIGSPESIASPFSWYCPLLL